jgi:hypothetical protein
MMSETMHAATFEIESRENRMKMLMKNNSIDQRHLSTGIPTRQLSCSSDEDPDYGRKGGGSVSCGDKAVALRTMERTRRVALCRGEPRMRLVRERTLVVLGILYCARQSAIYCLTFAIEVLE